MSWIVLNSIHPELYVVLNMGNHRKNGLQHDTKKIWNEKKLLITKDLQIIVWQQLTYKERILLHKIDTLKVKKFELNTILEQLLKRNNRNSKQ